MANVEGSIYRNENGVAVPYANLGGGGSDDFENNVNVASLVTPPTNMYVNRAFMCRSGRVTSLHIVLNFERAVSSKTMANFMVRIQDANGKCIPAINEMFHPGIACALISNESYWGILRGSTYDLSFSFFGMEIAGNNLHDFTMQDSITYDFTFLNKYEG